ncbi:TetR/AcrR family transcriptional regulator [Myxococcaceae bacterium GXIMD 01537]
MARKGASEAPRPTARSAAGRASTSREAILEAAKVLFLEHGYDGVNMDMLAASAGVARRTVYNQFASKDEIFQAMVAQQWAFFDTSELARFEDLEGDVADALRRVAQAILRFSTRADYVALVRMVIAESRRFPWVGREFNRLGKLPLMERFARYLRRQTEARVLDCRHPDLAAHQFVGLLNEVLSWPQVMAGGATLDLPDEEEIIREAVAMFLSRYRRAR